MRQPFSRALHFFAIAGCALLFPACAPKAPAHTEIVLGTVCTVNAFSDGTRALYAELFSRLHDIDKSVNPYCADSDISAVNAQAGRAPVPVGKDTFFIAQQALSFAERTDGAFNPALGAIISLWGINTDHARVPSDAEIAAALSHCSWRDITLNEADCSIFLPTKGMELDFGGIAKGFAADELVKILRAHSVKRAIINLGGNVYLYGKKSTKSAWQVGIKDPLQPEGENALVLLLPETSVVTSGTYERFFEENGRRYHHLFNPETGRPAGSGVLSVSVVCTSSLYADALSTALFVMGKEKGTAFLHTIPQAHAVFITEDKTVTVSPELPYYMISSEYTAAF